MVEGEGKTLTICLDSKSGARKKRTRREGRERKGRGEEGNYVFSLRIPPIPLCYPNNGSHHFKSLPFLSLHFSLFKHR